MNMEAETAQKLAPEQHPDFLWTWKSNQRSSKASIWLPYFSQATKVPRSKNWKVAYNGGELELDLSQVDFIMFYGASGEIPLAFLDDAAKHGIVLMVHRRHVPVPYLFYPSTPADPSDVLTKQILFRNQLIKRCCIAKTLIRERLTFMQPLIPIPQGVFRDLAAAKEIAKIRSIEAVTTARYWDAWFERLDVDSHRRSEHPLTTALDAASKFVYGIILRWVLFHKLSPNHGFLHEPTTYSSLIYDLIEPYRYIIEEAVAQAWLHSDKTEKECVAKTISYLKEMLDEVCYVPATRQYVRRKNLLHGVVLALRAYLLGEVKRLVVPVEGKPQGGRPPKVGYRLPGSLFDMDRKKPELGKVRSGGI